MIAFLFPGQGSQAPGMGRALADAYPVAKATFEEADDALGMKLSGLCFQGPEDELKRTEITQPAILTTSVALHRTLLAERPDLRAEVAAGHSLGELSALVTAGAIQFGDGVRLVKERGRLMQEAVPLGEGAMAAVLGLAPETVAAVCREVEAELRSVVVVANLNSPEQTVISGAKAAVDAAKTRLEAAGAGKVIALSVSAPFHSPLMAPAAEGLKAALSAIEIGPLAWPIVTNVEAQPNRDETRVKQLLIEQVTAPVRWVEIIQRMAAMGVTQALEIGPGKVLGGLVRRIDRAMKVMNVEDPASIKKALEGIGTGV